MFSFKLFSDILTIIYNVSNFDNPEWIFLRKHEKAVITFYSF